MVILSYLPHSRDGLVWHSSMNSSRPSGPSDSGEVAAAVSLWGLGGAIALSWLVML
jgi:hypothetical protein